MASRGIGMGAAPHVGGSIGGFTMARVVVRQAMPGHQWLVHNHNTNIWAVRFDVVVAGYKLDDAVLV